MDKFLATSLFPNRSFTPPGDDLTMSALGNTMQGLQEEDNHFPDSSPGPASKERLPIQPYKEGGVRTPHTHSGVSGLQSLTSQPSAHGRRFNHSKIKFTIDRNTTATDFTEFMKSIKAFESDEQVQWKRETLPAATKSVLRSQWTRWKYKEPGEDWLTMPTDRFLQFIKSVMHSYFKEAVDSGLTDPYIRIIQVLTKEKIFLEATTAVRQLEELGGGF